MPSSSTVSPSLTAASTGVVARVVAIDVVAVPLLTGCTTAQIMADDATTRLQCAGLGAVATNLPQGEELGPDAIRRLAVSQGLRPLRAEGARLVAEGKLAPGVAKAFEGQLVTYHDPCYLGRYGGTVDEPRALLERFGGTVAEPERNRDNPYCCGAGGGLLFEDTDAEPGTRISDVRFKQLRATGANTVVTACPFCSIMLKGAQSSAPDAATVQFVDLMTFVNGRLTRAGSASDRPADAS